MQKILNLKHGTQKAMFFVFCLSLYNVDSF